MELKHGDTQAIGILVNNLGTPSAPTEAALKTYLKEFLSDRRVIKVPRLIWWFILNCYILPTRAKRSAKLYEKIWTPEGSPLLIYTRRLADRFAVVLQQKSSTPVHIAVGMHYGEPSIAQALEDLQKKNCQKILLLPLFPQYSAATTASLFDAVSHILKNWCFLPELRLVTQYHAEIEYVQSLARHIENFWRGGERPERLVFSFHGLPKKNLHDGDPYYYQCHKTARLIAEALHLAPESWLIAFQSRFGKEEWLKPYLDTTLKDLAQKGIRCVDVVCPGFAVDCLETLEEIERLNRGIFLENGGIHFRYIPALNDSMEHAQALAAIASRHILDWTGTGSS